MKKAIPKRWTSVLLSVIMIILNFASILTINANATIITQQVAVDWAKNQVGKSLDFDGVNGAQCVDLIKYYYALFGYANYAKGNGNVYATNTLPPNWERYSRNDSNFSIQEGDILVWNKTTYKDDSGKTVTNEYGHVAISITTTTNINNVKVITQNPGSVHESKMFNTGSGYFWGIIRPKYYDASSPEFKYVTVKENTYYLKNKSTGTYLTVDQKKYDSNISVFAYNGGEMQEFVIGGLLNKTYMIKPSYDNTLNVNPYWYSKIPYGEGNNITLYYAKDESSDYDQHWGFESVSGGYILHNLKNESFVIGLDGNNVCLETRTGADDQIWVLESVSTIPKQDAKPCGENVYYVFDEATGTLDIYGNGDMFDYGIYHEDDNGRYAPWKDKADKIENIVIENGVTSIGEDAFRDLRKIKTLSLPSTLKKIGASSFQNCSLAEITIPNSVTAIDSFAFRFCTSLKKVKLSSNVTDYGAFLFDGCKDTIEITPENITGNIKSDNTDIEWKFNTKTGLLTFTGSGYINGTKEGPYALNYYRGAPWLAFGKLIKNVVIGNGILGVDYLAFYNCSISSFSLPSSLKYFRSSGVNKNVDFGVIPSAVLKGDLNKNLKWQIDKDKNELYINGSGAFYAASAWTYFPWVAFDCIINSVVIGDGVTALYDEDCIGNTLSYNSITLPTSIKTIGEGVFQRGDLKTLYYKGTSAQWKKINIGDNNGLLDKINIICLGDEVHVHTYGAWTKLNDTQHQRVCSCGEKETENHKWDSGKVTKEPTYTESGIKTYTCSVCNATKTETIKPLDNNTPAIVIGKVTAPKGKEVSVKISLKNNPGIASLKLVVSFDSALTLTKVEYGNKLNGSTQAPYNYNSPVTLNWYDGVSNTNGDIVYATLTFKVNDKANVGSKYEIRATYDQEDLFDINRNNVYFAVTNGSVTVGNAKMGDVNGDGALNNKDVLILFRYVSGWKNLTVNSDLADFNGDGLVNNKDVIDLFEYVSGL